jgi:hypothetical protein
MKPYFIAALIGFSALAGTAHAQVGGSLTRFRNHALPVLVQVNANGKITRVEPSIRLSPKTQRMLRGNLEQMITGPAIQDGHPVGSQLVIQVSLVKNKLDNGNYSARFKYVSAMPVPAGLWYWVTNGHEVALAADVAGMNPVRMPRWEQIRPRHQLPQAVPGSNTAPTSNSPGTQPSTQFHVSRPVVLRSAR